MKAGWNGGRGPPRKSGGGTALVGRGFRARAANHFHHAEQEGQERQHRGGGDQRAGDDWRDEVTELRTHIGSVRNASARGLHANEKSL